MSIIYIYISIPKWLRNIVQQCARDLVPLPMWTFQAFLGFSWLNSIHGYLCLNPVMCFSWKYKYVHISVENILSCMSTLPFKSPLAYCQFHPPVALLLGHLIRWAWPHLVNQNTSFSWEFSSQNSGIFLVHTPSCKYILSCTGSFVLYNHQCQWRPKQAGRCSPTLRSSDKGKDRCLLVHCCTFHLRSGLWNIDDQYRYPKDNTEII